MTSEGCDGTAWVSLSPPTPKTTNVLNITFDPFHINSVHFIVDASWLSDPDLAFDIKITGLNGQFALHGEQVVNLADMTVIVSNETLAQVAVEWTTDTIDIVTGEIYTACVTVVRFGTVPEGPEQCFDFGPF